MERRNWKQIWENLWSPYFTWFVGCDGRRKCDFQL